MKKLLIALGILAASIGLADVKIGDLPLVTAGSVGINDSFPFVAASANQTRRLKLDDLPNLTAFSSVYLPLTGGTLSGALGVTSITGPQFTVSYDNSDKVTESVSSVGATTWTVSGSGAKFNLTGGNVGIGSASPTQKLDVNGTATATVLSSPSIIASAATATTVPYLDGSKQIVSSSVTPTELGYLIGITSSLCGINQSCTLTNKTIDAGSNTITNLVNANISASAAIVDTKLATISTAGKVSNSATTATTANTPSAIVARDGSGNYSAGTATLGQVIDSGATASTVPYFDSSKQLTSSAVTPTQLSYVDFTSSGQTQINSKQSSTLTNTHILVGNVSNVATDVAVSGDLTIANTGAAAIAASAVTNAKLANMADKTVKANVSGGSAAPSDVSAVSTATASTFAVRDSSADIAFHKVTANSVNTNGSTGVASLTARNFSDSLGDGFSIQSANGTKQWDFDVRDAGQFFIFDVANGQVDFECTSVGCSRGAAAPANYGWEVNDSSAVTDQTSIPARPVSAVKNNDATNNNYSTLAFENSAGTTDAVILGVHKTHSSPGTADIVFLTENAGALSDKMHILANGNVGIGSTAPVQKLDVNGQANVTNFKNAATSAHGAVVTDSSNVQTSVAPGSSGNIMQSNGTDWVSAAVPGLSPFAPSVQTFASGSGTYNLDYTFTITSGSATAAATYTNNSVTFTVYSTVASATRVVMSGSGPPLTSGTLTKASGTGDATITFSAFNAPLYLKVKAAGGGGGGAGTGTGATNGGAGGNTTFGSSLLTANGGAGALTPANGDSTAAGGTATVASPAVKIFALSGGDGTSGDIVNLTSGVGGGSNPLGGAGGGGIGTVAAGSAGQTNTGGGGGGGGGNTSVTGGSSGGAGGYLDAMVISPSATYSYAIGAAGTAGAGGTGGFGGGAGGSGVVTVEEYYQ